MRAMPNYTSSTGTAVALTVVAPLGVAGVQIDTGETQRSAMQSVTVTLTGPRRPPISFCRNRRTPSNPPFESFARFGGDRDVDQRFRVPAPDLPIFNVDAVLRVVMRAGLKCHRAERRFCRVGPAATTSPARLMLLPAIAARESDHGAERRRHIVTRLPRELKVSQLV
jgi:hypothetical protein